jgi:hypothetical protein
MAEVQHSQIKSKLLELIAPVVDKSDIPGKSSADKNAHILSRSMAAAAIKMLAEVDDVTLRQIVVLALPVMGTCYLEPGPHYDHIVLTFKASRRFLFPLGRAAP